MEEGVEAEGEKSHETHTKNHSTQLYVPPVDDIQNCTLNREREQRETRSNNPQPNTHRQTL